MAMDEYLLDMEEYENKSFEKENDIEDRNLNLFYNLEEPEEPSENDIEDDDLNLFYNSEEQDEILYKKEENKLKDAKIEKEKIEHVDVLYNLLLEKKSSVKEINSILESMINEKMNSLKFSKLKMIFKMEKNTTAMIFIGMIFGLFGTSVISVVFSLLNGSFDIMWGTLSTIISLFGLSFFGNLFLKEFYKKDIIELIRSEILKNEEVNSENLMKLNVYFDKEDKKYISEMNNRNNGIFLSEIDKILNHKKSWIMENEHGINEKMKVKYNREILESA